MFATTAPKTLLAPAAVLPTDPTPEAAIEFYTALLKNPAGVMELRKLGQAEKDGVIIVAPTTQDVLELLADAVATACTLQLTDDTLTRYAVPLNAAYVAALESPGHIDIYYGKVGKIAEVPSIEAARRFAANVKGLSYTMAGGQPTLTEKSRQAIITALTQ